MFFLSGGFFLYFLVIGIVVEINFLELLEVKVFKSFKLKDLFFIFWNKIYCIFVFNMVLFGLFGKMYMCGIVFFCVV